MKGRYHLHTSLISDTFNDIGFRWLTPGNVNHNSTTSQLRFAVPLFVVAFLPYSYKKNSSLAQRSQQSSSSHYHTSVEQRRTFKMPPILILIRHAQALHNVAHTFTHNSMPHWPYTNCIFTRLFIPRPCALRPRHRTVQETARTFDQERKFDQ